MKVELLIIGSGPAGYVAAIKAAQIGLNVALVESNCIGGTCLNSGCIPTKTFLSYAETIESLKKPRKGVKVNSYDVNIEEIYSVKQEVVNKLVKGIEALLKFWKIKIIKGTASFTSFDSVKVGSDTIQFDKAIIATGSKSIVPEKLNISGFTVDSNSVLADFNIGKKIIIVGGGVIGIELAFILNSFDIQVIIVEKLKNILATEDADAVRYIENSMKKRGIVVYKETSVQHLEAGKVFLSNGEVIEADKCVVAIGRVSNVDKLECKLGGIELTEKKAIKTDNCFKTTNPKVFAIGDVTGTIQLAHYASALASMVVSNIAGKQCNTKLDAIPRIIYSVPELAVVGITEHEAKEKGLDYKIGKFMYAANGRALVSDTSEGFIKVLSDSNGIILGASALGSNADLLIMPFTIAMAHGLTVSDLSDVIYPHPTLSEMIHEACEDVNGSAVHKMRRVN